MTITLGLLKYPSERFSGEVFAAVNDCFFILTICKTHDRDGDADPNLGEYGPPVVLFQSGEIPDLE